MATKFKRIKVTIDHSGKIIKKDVEDKREATKRDAKDSKRDDTRGIGLPNRVAEQSKEETN